MHSAASNTDLTTGKFLSSPVTKSNSKHLGLIGCLNDATRGPGSFLFFTWAFFVHVDFVLMVGCGCKMARFPL